MSATKYTIQSGDTLGGIASQFDLALEELALRNNIKDPNFIQIGQVLIIRDAPEAYIVKSGDTLSQIAAEHNVTVAEIMSANPEIRNANLISVGQAIIIPSAGQEQPASSSNHVKLSEKDIINIKKTLQTEWVPFAGDDQAKGIVDTILNRLASDHWGSSIAPVVNAHNQFSDINGPISRKKGRSSVEQFAFKHVRARTRNLVDDYLAARAGGAPSIIDSHLNYANPHFSDAKNLRWIMALDGLILGKGNAIHRHGTVPELQRLRPKPYAIVLPGDDEPANSRATGSTSIDGRAVAAANNVGVKSRSVKIGKLHPSMEDAIVAVSEAAAELGLPRPVITSGNDSRHSPKSLHYANRALDFRGRNITIAAGAALDLLVTKKLGPKYDVLFETFAGNKSNNHLHVEFDPR